MTVTAQRRTEYTDVLASAETWVGTRSDIRALGLAGSWAREEAQMSSDVDLVVLTNEIEWYVADLDWVPLATGQVGRIVRTQPWGPVMERRIELPSGLLVEYGFAPVNWASTDPLDAGTARVVTDGFRVLYDPDGLLSRLVAAVLG
jgi:hypothetical protein